MGARMAEIEYVTKDRYEADLARIDAEENRQNARLASLDDAVKEIGNLAISIERLAMNVASMQKTLEAQTARLTQLEEEPGDNWRKAVWIVLAAIIGAAVGAGLRSIGL